MQAKAEPFVLLVDDESDVTEFMAKQFLEQNIKTKTARNFEEAWEIICKFQGSLAFVISDLRLKGKSGLDLRAQMLPKFRDIPFIIFSGFIDKKILEKGLEFKVDQFIDKPFMKDRRDQLIKEKIIPSLENAKERMVLRSIFLDEVGDSIGDLEQLILTLEGQPDNQGIIDGIFRIVHTIKGGSGVLEKADFTRFLHSYEDLFSKVKSGKISINDEFISTSLAAFDSLQNLISDAREWKDANIDLDAWKIRFADTIRSCPIKEDGQKNSQDGIKDDDGISGKESQIKISSSTLDDFMELSGEITVIRNTVNRLVASLEKEIPGNKDIRLLREFLEEMHKITSRIQAKVTDLRKVPMETVYFSLPRILRDLRTSLKKKIKMDLTGNDVKVDTKLAQTLNNSLTHIIRNCADHGLESGDVRLENGKSEEGRISISCVQKEDIINVEIEDDGKGIDKDAVIGKAIENQLYSEDQLQSMSEERVFGLIMEPGFSTASKVTDISGRGVGMDMVKNCVEKVGGKIGIRSRKGIGTKFSLALPIPRSVVIINSLSVHVGDQIFNIPQESIRRILYLEKKSIDKYIRKLEGADFLMIDDQLIALVSLADILKIPSNRKSDDVLNIAIVKGQDQRIIGIIFDDIGDAEEVVLKPMTSFLNVHGMFAGATFMGDGSISLIINVDGIITRIGVLEHYNGKNQLLNVQQTLDANEYILVSLTSSEKFAIKVQDINRLEEISLEDVKTGKIRPSIIYVDQIVPIYFVGDDRDLNNYLSAENHKIPLIIVAVGQKFRAVVIKEVIDIIRLTSEVDKNVSSDPWIEGQLISDTGIVSIIDIYEVIGIDRPIENQNNTEESVLDPSEIEEKNKEQELDKKNNSELDQDVSQVAGFGLF